MRKVLLALALSPLLAGTLLAQITVKVILDQDQFLPGETMPVSVRIVNHSGQTLKLGAERDWLTFSVEGRNGALVTKNGEVPVAGEFTLATSKMATKTVDIAPFFSLSNPGRYEITATVKIPGWEQLFSSAPEAAQITRGTKVWDTEFGVPQAEAHIGPPEVRKYALVQSMQGKRMTLFVRVTDVTELQLFKLTAVGSVVSFSQPEHQLDRDCNLHLLWQNGARTYQYAVVGPEGLLLVHQTYDFEATRPKLSLDENGRIRVVGGERRKTSSDVPAENPAVKPGEKPQN